MLRPASRIATRATLLRPITRSTPARRFLSTAPPSQTSRTWRNKAVRLGLAGAVVYYYNTADIFAEEPALAHLQPQAEPEDPLPTLEALAEQKAQSRARVSAAAQQQDVAVGSESQPAPSSDPTTSSEPSSVEELEQEADQQGAFNPETGEINWSCPCLGGMADGPCGPQFKEAFSCFVYSTEEPKGMDCIDKFKNMQDCFREYPDIYGAELEDDVEEQSRELDAEQEREREGREAEVEARTSTEGKKEVDLKETLPDTKAPSSKEDQEIDTSSSRPAYTHGDKVAAHHPTGPSDDAEVNERRRVAKEVAKAYETEDPKKVAKDVKSQEQTSESESVVPKAAHDGR